MVSLPHLIGDLALALLNSLRNISGVRDIRSAGIVATAPGSQHSRLPTLPEESLVLGPEEAARFDANRVSDGTDYIKIVADVPGP